MIDTHCHLDSARFSPDRTQVLQRARAAGVEAVVLPGVEPESWSGLLEDYVGDTRPGDARVAVALGVHPQAVPELGPDSQDEAVLERLDAMISERVVAVGECGLDGPTAKGSLEASMARQVRLLRGHLRIARRHGLPVLVHCLRAHPALLELLEDEPLPEAGVLLHSYSGGAELAERYLRLGCHFSFAGPVTYAGARKPLDAVRRIPVDRLMVETDGPDQAPHPHRGQRSEPAYLPLIVAALARTLGLPEDELASRTTDNAHRLFPRLRGAR